MESETVVSYRSDREIRKNIIVPGDYNLVPYEDSRCKIKLTEISCRNAASTREIETDCRILDENFDGNVLIGDCNNYIDKDFELILQQMCCGEVSAVKIIYKDSLGLIQKEINCNIELKEVTEEQLISDWSWQRLYESATYHKDCGVMLVKEKRTIDAFRRFSKALKILVAIEPVDPENIDKRSIKQIIDLKIKLYNNLAHCQLQYNEYDAVLELCNRALKHDSNNVKALYRRCLAYTGLNLLESAWTDIQHVLQLDPNDKVAQQRASSLKPKIQSMNNEYKTVIKKMFG